MSIAGAGFGASQALEQIMADQMVRAQHAQRERENAERLALEQQRFAETVKQQTIANQRQQRLDDEAAADRRSVRNITGIRRMMGDRLTQQSGPLSQDDLRGIAALQVEAGDTPNLAALTPQAPKRTVITTIGKRGEPIKKAVTDEELVSGIPEYREPRSSGNEPNYLTLIDGNGHQQRVPDGARANALLQQGWRIFDPVAARSTQGVGISPTKAAETRQNILDAAKALKNAAGLGSMTGARGWSYGLGLSGENPLPGTAAAGAKARFDTLKSLMTLENLGLLKGAMSDKDLAFIQSAGSALSPNMDDATFARELDSIIEKFENVQGVPPGGGAPLTELVYDPATKTLKAKGGQ